MKTRDDENFVKKLDGLMTYLIDIIHFCYNENQRDSKERYFQNSWTFNLFRTVTDDKILALKL